MRNVTSYPGQTLILECEASGFPVPFINWRLNWGHVCEEPRCFTKSEAGRGTLTITNARASDSGAYSCEAINSKGRVFAIPDALLTIRRIGTKSKTLAFVFQNEQIFILFKMHINLLQVHQHLNLLLSQNTVIQLEQ